MGRHELVQLLATQSVRRGEFTLASGRSSSLYIDARLTTMSPEGLTLIGTLGLHALEQAGWYVDSVGGMTLGADPIAYAIAYASASTAVITLRNRPRSSLSVVLSATTRSSDRPLTWFIV